MGTLVGQTEQNIRQALQDRRCHGALRRSMATRSKRHSQRCGLKRPDRFGRQRRLFGTLLTYLNDHDTDVMFSSGRATTSRNCRRNSRGPNGSMECFSSICPASARSRRSGRCIWRSSAWISSNSEARRHRLDGSRDSGLLPTVRLVGCSPVGGREEHRSGGRDSRPNRSSGSGTGPAAGVFRRTSRASMPRGRAAQARARRRDQPQAVEQLIRHLSESLSQQSIPFRGDYFCMTTLLDEPVQHRAESSGDRLRASPRRSACRSPGLEPARPSRPSKRRKPPTPLAPRGNSCRPARNSSTPSIRTSRP